MGGGKGGDAPDAPDPVEAIKAQAQFNRINTFTPFGNLTFSSSPAQTRQVTRRVGGGGKVGGRFGEPRFETFTETIPGTGGINDIATITLSPEQQRQLDLQNIITEQLLRGGLDRVAGLPTEAPDFSLQGANFENPIFERAAASLRPEFDLQREQLMSDLQARGIPLNSPAFNEALNRLEDNQNQLLTDIGTQTAVQDINLQQSNRATQFNELAAVLGLQQVSPQQVAQTGNFFGPGAVDVLGAQQLGFQGDLAGFQAEQQGRQNFLGGLFGLGQAAILGGGLPGLFGGGGAAGGGGFLGNFPAKIIP